MVACVPFECGGRRRTYRDGRWRDDDHPQTFRRLILCCRLVFGFAVEFIIGIMCGAVCRAHDKLINCIAERVLDNVQVGLKCDK